MFIRWNLYKADAIGAKKQCPLYRNFFYDSLIAKQSRSVPRHTVRLIKVSALYSVRFVNLKATAW